MTREESEGQEAIPPLFDETTGPRVDISLTPVNPESLARNEVSQGALDAARDPNSKDQLMRLPNGTIALVRMVTDL